MPEKLERQLGFMRDRRIGACFTSYETVNEDGDHRNYVHVDAEVGYHRFLTKPPTCSHTVMFDTAVVDRALLVMPDIRKRQDAATWLQVIKAGHRLHGLDEVLAVNRKRRARSVRTSSPPSATHGCSTDRSSGCGYRTPPTVCSGRCSTQPSRE